MQSVTIATRGSKLALWQAHWVESQLRNTGIETSIKIIRTSGDKVSEAGLDKLGSTSVSKGIFTKEIEEALLLKQVDLAVHSLKDMPTEIDKRLSVAIIPKRADARDAVVGRPLKELKKGDRVGTSSLRRAAQMRNLRPEINIVDIRGNVDTRIKKLDKGQYDSILLASAGLHRLGLENLIAEILNYDVMLPAAGQGALAIEIRSDDTKTFELLSPLHNPETARAVTAERALLHALGGGCQIPVGVHAVENGSFLTLSAAVVSPDGTLSIKAQQTSEADYPEALGRKMAKHLITKGAQKIIDSL